MPGFQTKALVTSISSANFRIIPPNCTVSKACDALANVYETDLWSVRCTRDHSHGTEQNKQRLFVVLSRQDPKVWQKYVVKSGKVFE